MTRPGKLAALMRALSWRRVAAELRETESRFQQVTDHIREVFFLVDPGITRMFYVSPGYEELWGRSCESLYANPRSFGDAIHVEDRERAFQTFAPQGTVIPFDVEYRIVRPDSTVRWVRARGFPIRDASGQIYRFAGFAEDITERKDAMDLVTHQAQALERGNRRLALLGEMTGLLQTAVRIEEAAAIVEGYVAQLRVGDSGGFYLFKESRNYLDLLARWGEPKLADSVVPGECWALRRGQAYRAPGAQPTLRCKHARQLEEAATHLCVPMMAESGALGLLHVVFANPSPAALEEDALLAQRTAEQLGLALANFKLRETLRIEAMQDALTGLYNRRFLEITLKREFARAVRENNSVAVAMVDVDHFKRFNDAHGHDAGDVALRQLGKVLQENCRASDLACRFGGEEFTVVIPGATREAVKPWTERLLAKVRDMKVIADGVLLPQLTVSIGLAFFPEHGEETAEVIQTADQALYAAKRAGRDRCVFSPGHS
ncbi:MAG TPA: diguanylate cyclase [Burkholderiales bacterium]|nr:diguanylate cyclase [Burkholderiales bacterium]